MGVILQVALPSRVLAVRLGSSAVPPVQVRAAGLAYVRSTRAWQLAENHRATWKSTIFSLGWVRGVTRSVQTHTLSLNYQYTHFSSTMTNERQDLKLLIAERYLTKLD